MTSDDVTLLHGEKTQHHENLIVDSQYNYEQIAERELQSRRVGRFTDGNLYCKNVNTNSNVKMKCIRQMVILENRFPPY